MCKGYYFFLRTKAKKDILQLLDNRALFLCFQYMPAVVTMPNTLDSNPTSQSMGHDVVEVDENLALQDGHAHLQVVNLGEPQFNQHLQDVDITQPQIQEHIEATLEEDDNDNQITTEEEIMDAFFERQDMLLALQNNVHDNSNSIAIERIEEEMGRLASRLSYLPLTRMVDTEALPRVTIQQPDKGNDAENCVICKDDFTVGSTATQLPCRHMYHGDCINQWLANHHVCPLCRFDCR